MCFSAASFTAGFYLSLVHIYIIKQQDNSLAHQEGGISLYVKKS